VKFVFTSKCDYWGGGGGHVAVERPLNHSTFFVAFTLEAPVVTICTICFDKLKVCILLTERISVLALNFVDKWRAISRYSSLAD
jgi:hypothetical protein